MSWTLNRTTNPTTEPVTSAEVEEKLAFGSGWNAATLAISIPAARQSVEADTERSLINQTWTLKLDKFPSGDTIYLPKGPFSSITSFGYVDTDGDSQTLSVTTDYTIESNGDVAKIRPVSSGWPSDVSSDIDGSITIVYVAGYGSLASDIPEWAKEAIFARITRNYSNGVIDTSHVYEDMTVPNKIIFDYNLND